MIQCLQTFSGLQEMSIIWVPLADGPTIRNIEELRKLHVNFCTEEQGEREAVRPVADLSTLPKLQEITLSTGWMEDIGPSSLNCHFTNRSESVRTLRVEAESLDGYQLASPLPATLAKFSRLQHLVLYNIRGQHLSNINLPFLKTLEAYWCSPKTILGMKIPRVKDLSVAIAAQVSGDPIWDVSDLLNSAARIVIRIEWDVSDYDSLAAVANGELLNISSMYSALKRRPREACLIAGDVTGPGASIPWLHYRRRARHSPSRPSETRLSAQKIDIRDAKHHREERSKSLKKLGLVNVFRDSQEQDFEW